MRLFSRKNDSWGVTSIAPDPKSVVFLHEAQKITLYAHKRQLSSLTRDFDVL